jgi:hypothetical protein
MWRTAVLGIVAESLLAACGSSKPNGSAPTTASTAPTTSPATAPPTTVWVPSAPQSTPDGAAARLVSAWATGSQAAAASIAPPAVVSTLFAQPYPTGYLQARGCTQGANPGTCTYRNTRTNGIYEIEVTDAASGWYVSAVTPES